MVEVQGDDREGEEGGRWLGKACGKVEVSLIETSGWRRKRGNAMQGEVKRRNVGRWGVWNKREGKEEGKAKERK